MPFAIGNTNAAKARKFYDAMMRAAAADDFHALRKIADKTLELAIEGESWAVTMVRDTLDGKPHQQVSLSNADGTPLQFATVEALRARIRGDTEVIDVQPAQTLPAVLEIAQTDPEQV